MLLGEMITPAARSSPRNLPAEPSIRTKEDIKVPVKREIDLKKEEMQTDGIKDEVRSAVTRDRNDTHTQRGRARH